MAITQSRQRSGEIETSTLNGRDARRLAIASKNYRREITNLCSLGTRCGRPAFLARACIAQAERPVGSLSSTGSEA